VLCEPLILADTKSWIVVNKPSGWLSIAGRGQPGVPVLVDWLEQRWEGIWVVHRLDIETSGVMLFARSAEAHRLANNWFSSHEVRKVYEFLASGEPRSPTFIIKDEIAGKRACTQVEVLERFGKERFLGRALPVTGRRHQIRLHLARQGLPLLGDIQYGGDPRGVGRVALHAASLRLPSGEEFRASWPEDFS